MLNNFFGGNSGGGCDLIWLIILLNCICGNDRNCCCEKRECCEPRHKDCCEPKCCDGGFDICTLLIILLICGGGFGFGGGRGCC